MLMWRYCVFSALVAFVLQGLVEGAVIRRGIHTCRHDELGNRILYVCSTFIDKRQYQVDEYTPSTSLKEDVDAEYADYKLDKGRNKEVELILLKQKILGWADQHLSKSKLETMDKGDSNADAAKIMNSFVEGADPNVDQKDDGQTYYAGLLNLQNEKYLLDQFRDKVEREERELEVLENFYNSYKESKAYVTPTNRHRISKRDNEEMNRLLSKCCHEGCRDNDFAFLCHNH